MGRGGYIEEYVGKKKKKSISGACNSFNFKPGQGPSCPHFGAELVKNKSISVSVSIYTRVCEYRKTEIYLENLSSSECQHIINKTINLEHNRTELLLLPVKRSI